jgi:hypothetical protein
MQAAEAKTHISKAENPTYCRVGAVDPAGSKRPGISYIGNKDATYLIYRE